MNCIWDMEMGGRGVTKKNSLYLQQGGKRKKEVMRIMQVNTYQHETRFISEKKP